MNFFCSICNFSSLSYEAMLQHKRNEHSAQDVTRHTIEPMLVATNHVLPLTNSVNFQSPSSSNISNSFLTPTRYEQVSLLSPLTGYLPKMNDFSRVASLVCQNPDIALNQNIAESLTSADSTLRVQPVDLSLQNWSRIENDTEQSLWNSPNLVQQNVPTYQIYPDKEFQILSNFNPVAANDSHPFDLEGESNSSNYFTSSLIEQGGSGFDYVTFTPEDSPKQEPFDDSQTAFKTFQIDKPKDKSFNNFQSPFLLQQERLTHLQSSVTVKAYQKCRSVKKPRQVKRINKKYPGPNYTDVKIEISQHLTRIENPKKNEIEPVIKWKRSENVVNVKNVVDTNVKRVYDIASIPEKFFMGSYIKHIYRPSPRNYKKINIKESKIAKGCRFCLDASRVAKLSRDEIILVHERVRICFRNQSQKYGKLSSECPLCIYIVEDLGYLVPKKSRLVHEEMTWCVQKWVLEMGQGKIFKNFPNPIQLSEIIDYSIKLAQQQIDDLNNEIKTPEAFDPQDELSDSDLDPMEVPLSSRTRR